MTSSSKCLNVSGFTGISATTSCDVVLGFRVVLGTSNRLHVHGIETCAVFLSSYRNTNESSGEQEMLFVIS